MAGSKLHPVARAPKLSSQNVVYQ